jgi:hypothetical protein
VNFIKNEKGYLTVESAILLPSLLLLVCIFVGFFCIAYKIGAFQALVNHEQLVAMLDTTHNYKIEQIEDTQTQLTIIQNKRKQFDDLVHIKQTYQVKIEAPFYRQSVIAESSTDEWTLPMIDQLFIAKKIGSGQQQLREWLGGKK